jgi:hypothetical protein
LLQTDGGATSAISGTEASEGRLVFVPWVSYRPGAAFPLNSVFDRNLRYRGFVHAEFTTNPFIGFIRAWQDTIYDHAFQPVHDRLDRFVIILVLYF